MKVGRVVENDRRKEVRVLEWVVGARTLWKRFAKGEEERATRGKYGIRLAGALCEK
jgi:hypothetical protein